MTTHADFTADEWDALLAGPALAGLIVSAAQPGDWVRETATIEQAYIEAEKEHPGFDLLGEIVARVPELSPPELYAGEAPWDDAIEQIRRAVAVLEAKGTPEELDAYSWFAFNVAERVALAARSGDVLGIGGELVSDAEHEALARVAAALGLEPPD